MRIEITASPSVKVNGELNIPDEIAEENITDYIEKYWEDIEFEEPEINLENADYEWDYSHIRSMWD